MKRLWQTFALLFVAFVAWVPPSLAPCEGQLAIRSSVASNVEPDKQEASAQQTSRRPQLPGVVAPDSIDALRSQSVGTRPNIVLINLDDADVDLFTDEILSSHLPNIRQLATEGLRFKNCHVVTPLCGPSRTCLLRGQHAHRTGIKTNVAAGPMNNGFTGGYELFKQQGFEQEHLGVWMQRSGYRTMMIGKYLHGRMNPTGVPGWDDLHICFGGNYYATSRYSTRLPEGERRQATGPTDYRTVVEADEAVWMIEQQGSRNAKNSNENAQPFFLYIAPLAPHKPAAKTVMLQTKYRDLARDIRLRDTPDLNEADVSDKPESIQVERLRPQVMNSLHEEHRKRVVSLKSVDDMVKKIRTALQQTGVADNTYIFFTSDHGYQLGHNRMIAKKVPYHRNTVVPMFVVGPGVKRGASKHLLAHIDLVPTFLELAGGKAPIELDGKSWVPLLSDPDVVSAGEFRDALLIQNWEEKSQLGTLIPATYASLRMADEIYTEWSNGEREYYQLKEDPFQLHNSIKSVSAERQSAFSKRLHALKRGETQPIVTLACPELISKNTRIRGFAEDDDAIQAVYVTIENPGQGKYWSGTTWSSEKSSTEARLLNRGGLISNWETVVDLSAIENNGEIVVTAESVDTEGNRSDPLSQTFRVDAIEPETVLKLPATGTTVESPVTLFGFCSDNSSMQGIELVLENLDNRTFWNGSQWSRQESTFFKRVAQERWHTTLDVPPGRYRAVARARDQAGNNDETPAVNEFSVK